MSPVALSLDGNFVDEIFRCASDIFQAREKYAEQDRRDAQFAEVELADIEKIKQDMGTDDLKKIEPAY